MEYSVLITSKLGIEIYFFYLEFFCLVRFSEVLGAFFFFFSQLTKMSGFETDEIWRYDTLITHEENINK